MIVGCYTMDLYCNARVLDENHTTPDMGRGGFAQFIGRNGPACAAQARRAGWQLSFKHDCAVCPGCTKLGVSVRRVVRLVSDVP